MAATTSVPHASGITPPRQQNQQLRPRNGVVTLAGYGISLRVERGHLILEDGVGDERRAGRFARVNHGLSRVVVIGNDGSVSLSAIRWLADQNASFVMLERDGSVLLTTGPSAPSDARVRRAQAITGDSDAGLAIARELIDMKLAGQEQVARDKVCNAKAADAIARYRGGLENANSVSSVRFIESQGGSAYWNAWRALSIEFPKRELPRVAEHWRTFGSRNSPVSNAPRNACNPGNAMLNFLYTMLESETRLAIAALGLDPGFGLIHVDSAIRDSLVYDLMEPIRPRVDAVLFDWLKRGPLNRSWFFEQRDGTCRLMPELCERLAETSDAWKRETQPIAEWYAQAVCATSEKRIPGPRSRLTRSQWKRARNRPTTELATVPVGQKVCANCGAAISKRRTHCKACAVTVSSAALVEGAKAGRIQALSPESRAKRKASHERHAAELRAWNPADMPEWLTSEFYTSQIQPRLAGLTRTVIAEAIGVSIPYASEMRNGNVVPHMRHWKALAELAAVSEA